ncbi:ABC transporter permease [Thalassolituus sp. LLYu03]|uniref:ABC transporter permease n=1 Tax=Thalassolituus sp. LLYu03 TaxID=3421656 RepID=UPI003D2ADFD5
MIRTADQLAFASRALLRQRFRTLMQLIAMSIGVLAVVLLTGMGEGGRQYVLGEFSALGKDILIMLPGRKETSGGMPPMTGEGTRDITLQDAESILRLPDVEQIAPLVVGQSEISRGARARESLVLGANAAFFTIRQIKLARGQMLPDIPLDQPSPVCVIGETLRQELFSAESALGSWVDVDAYRCRVIGILADTGTGLGMNMSEALILPVASAMQIYNTEGLFRVMIDVRVAQDMKNLIPRVEQIMRERHDGQLDVTLITPDSILRAFDNILSILTLAIAGIGAISLFVAGVLIMNMTLITVSQRTAEIGLLKALGASSQEVRSLFVLEAVMLSLFGGLLGLTLAQLCLWGARLKFPDIPFAAPLWASSSALLIAVVCGLLFSWIPASRAAAMAPVLALAHQNGK